MDDRKSIIPIKHPKMDLLLDGFKLVKVNHDIKVMLHGETVNRLYRVKEIITPRPKLPDGQITIVPIIDGVTSKPSRKVTAKAIGCKWGSFTPDPLRDINTMEKFMGVFNVR